MNTDDFSRRRFLHAAGQSLGIAWVGLNWSDVAEAVEAAYAAAQSSASFKFSFLTPAEVADVEAIAAQIIPTDDTPGAREAGVVYFIDRALATFFSRLAGPTFACSFTTFRSRCKADYPEATSLRDAVIGSADRVPQARRAHAILRRACTC